MKAKCILHRGTKLEEAQARGWCQFCKEKRHSGKCPAEDGAKNG